MTTTATPTTMAMWKSTGRASHTARTNPNGCELHTYNIDVHIIQQNVNTIFSRVCVFLRANLFYRNDHRRAFWSNDMAECWARKATIVHLFDIYLIWVNISKHMYYFTRCFFRVHTCFSWCSFCAVFWTAFFLFASFLHVIFEVLWAALFLPLNILIVIILEDRASFSLHFTLSYVVHKTHQRISVHCCIKLNLLL